jgi:Secretion system C-terminal sorting domain
MKSFILFSFLWVTNTLMAQTFEIRAVNVSATQIGVEFRATSNPTPAATMLITDLVFGIKWASACNTDFNTTSIVSNYNVKASGNRLTSGSYHYRGFYGDNVPFNVPTNWALNTWVRILTINTTGGVGNCTFEICEVGFDAANDPDIGIDNGGNMFFTPVINGSANSVVLPIELLSFEAKESHRTGVLDWQTVNEKEVQHFEIEQSNDGKTFKRVGIVEARNKQDNKEQYSFTDKNPFIGATYYRLKMVDRSEAFRYSSVESINLEGKMTINVYPNPTNVQLNIDVNLLQDDKLDIALLDVAGRIIKQSTSSAIKGENNIVINTNDVPSGFYLLKLQTANNSYSQKVRISH